MPIVGPPLTARWGPTKRSPAFFPAPRLGRERPKLPALPLTAREARPTELEANYPAGPPAHQPMIRWFVEALPSALGAALGNPVSLLALEARRSSFSAACSVQDWHKTHSGLPQDHA